MYSPTPKQRRRHAAEQPELQQRVLGDLRPEADHQRDRAADDQQSAHQLAPANVFLFHERRKQPRQRLALLRRRRRRRRDWRSLPSRRRGWRHTRAPARLAKRAGLEVGNSGLRAQERRTGAAIEPGDPLSFCSTGGSTPAPLLLRNQCRQPLFLRLNRRVNRRIARHVERFRFGQLCELLLQRAQRRLRIGPRTRPRAANRTLGIDLSSASSGLRQRGQSRRSSGWRRDRRPPLAKDRGQHHPGAVTDERHDHPQEQ